jgi:hypothetical protein
MEQFPRPAEPPEDDGRPPLASGHVRSWGALLRGTTLEGLAWPGYGTCGWDAPHLPRGEL